MVISMTSKDEKFILWFEETGIEDVPLVGGKNASLGEMIRELAGKGISVPNGFAITADAYKHLLKHGGVEDEIKQILSDLDTHNIQNLRSKGKQIRELIENIDFPDELTDAIKKAYDEMGSRFDYGSDPPTEPYHTARIRDSDTSTYTCPSPCKKWCALIHHPRVSCSR